MSKDKILKRSNSQGAPKVSIPGETSRHPLLSIANSFVQSIEKKTLLKGVIPSDNTQYQTLLEALMKADNVDSFSVDHQNKVSQIFIGEWSLELYANGTWKLV